MVHKHKAKISLKAACLPNIPHSICRDARECIFSTKTVYHEAGLLNIIRYYSSVVAWVYQRTDRSPE